MLKYTTSKQADEKVGKDTKVIVKLSLNSLKQYGPKAIVMFGGFGHQGGSFKKIGEEILPLNDYDLYIISKKQIPGEVLEEIGEKCSKALGRGGLEIVENPNEKYDENKFFHVDLHCLTIDKLRKPYPTQRTFDLKTSIVVWGDKNILGGIPQINVSKSDALRLLFNKLDHFAIAENNAEIIKSLYSVKGFTDLTSALLIFYGKYVSRYQDRLKLLEKMNVPSELKKHVKKATDAKLNKGYHIEDVNKFFIESKKWVLWTLKKILKEHLEIKSDDWKEICNVMYKKLPYVYFNDYLKNRFLFLGQYYLNWRFFKEGKRKQENIGRVLTRWRDAGLILAIALILYSVGEECSSEKYLRKLTYKTKPLKGRILKLYSIYYLQKLV